jgi:hypothetical protein
MDERVVSSEQGKHERKEADVSRVLSKDGYLSGMSVTSHLKRIAQKQVALSLPEAGQRPTLAPFNLASNRGLPSQRLSTLLVRSYRTFAPLPQTKLGRYLSVALSSRSPALGVTQQVWSLGSPDFPQA